MHCQKCISSSLESLKRSLDCSPNDLVRLIFVRPAKFLWGRNRPAPIPTSITQLRDFAAEFIFVCLGQFHTLRGHTLGWGEREAAEKLAEWLRRIGPKPQRKN
jgi:hypothetical protein